MGSAVVGTCSALFGSVTMPSYLWLTPARRTCDLPRVNPHPSSLSSLRSLQSALHLSNLQRHLSTALSLGEGPRAPFKKVQSLTEDGKVSNSFFFLVNPTGIGGLMWLARYSKGHLFTRRFKELCWNKWLPEQIANIYELS